MCCASKRDYPSYRAKIVEKFHTMWDIISIIIILIEETCKQRRGLERDNTYDILV